MGILTYRDLDVWQKSMELVVEVYELIKDFLETEKFGLSSQKSGCFSPLEHRRRPGKSLHENISLPFRWYGEN